MSSRYEGKPLLRLLECYVLDAIGRLTDKNRVALDKMTPTLEKLYGHSGSWIDILEKEMRFSNDMKNKISEMWERNTLSTQGSPESMNPEHFAQTFVDTNFSF